MRSILCLGDVCLAAAAPVLALYLRNQFELGSGDGEMFSVYPVSSALASLLLLLGTGCLRATWRYFSLHDAARAAQAIALGVAIGAVAGFACDRLQGVARAVPFIQVLLQLSGFVGARLICRRLAVAERASSAKARQVLVVGTDQAALTYQTAIRELSAGSIEVAGFLTEDRTLIGQTIRGKRVLGTIADIGEVIATLQVHGIDVWRVAVATSEPDLPYADRQAIEAATQRFALARIDVGRVLAAFTTLDLEPDAETAAAAVAWKPLYAATKRTIDICGAAVLLTLAAPLMVVLCALVAVDVGVPVFFWQQRLGKDGKRLTVYKFRTMRAPLDGHGRRIPDAQRVSLIGHWMRKLRLDELPQLISILTGDMSFVGPRPLLPIDQPSDAARRLSVKPGLTGWAQVHGGNLVAIEDKNALDLWYVAHSSLTLDIEIALRTIRMLLKGDNLDHTTIEKAKAWAQGLDFAGT